jgi:oxepin-CoA hydrolase/3-oxo-5,6-dehydrosuberyl-CoA semialdehyde dehydrogenase
MSNQLPNYALGEWKKPTGDLIPQYDAVTGELISQAGSGGLDFGEMMDYARKVGNCKLRKMTFHERGLMIKRLALHLHAKRKEYYPLSYRTGATKVDSWIDIEGGIGNLFANASLRKRFPNQPYDVDGEYAPLSKGGTFIGHHIMVPRRGVAVHINAFNFPIWGMLEKCAVNWLAGMPAGHHRIRHTT